MTLIGTDGFEARTTGSGAGDPAQSLFKWDNASTWFVGRTGNCFSSMYTATDKLLSAAQEHATLVFGAAVQPRTGASTSDLIVFKSDAAATTHITVQLTSAGVINVYRGTSGGTLIGTTTTPVLPYTAGIWRYLEVKATLHDTAGAVVVKVDETQILSLTGVDTKNGGTKTVFDSMILDQSGGIDLVDDVYLCNGAGSDDNDFLGAVHIVSLFPSGNGNSSQWVGSDGNSTDNFALVRQTTVNTSSYVDGATTGDKDTYATDDISGFASDATIKGVMVYAFAEKLDAGIRVLDLVARSGSNETATEAEDIDGNTGLINGAYKWVGAPFETKPGGGAWTVSDINNAEFGVQAG